MPDLRFDEKEHRYFLGDRELVPVSTVLQNAGLSTDYSTIPADILNNARIRGNYVHAAVQLEDEDDLDCDSVPEDYQPYIRSYRKFVKETGYKPIHCELRVHDPELGYAGTLDKLGIINARRGLIDIKCTAVISPATAIQTAAYENGFMREYPSEKVDFRAALQLGRDKYVFETYDNPTDFSIFKSALAIHWWRVKNKCKS